MTMNAGWSRRKFVGATAGVLGGLGVIGGGLWFRGRDPALGTGGKGDVARASLPPRVVGLRTSGGNFRFDPVGLRVEPGTDIIFLNMGDFHTATAFHPDYGHLLGPETCRTVRGCTCGSAAALGPAGPEHPAAAR